ncbi:hypothetical protein [Belnapia sp. F-4-1]|uniref:hypothetical protein n=1 Tax=Belnapia sp. F-4-1 TaxID=1545443 RepID=UPI0011864F0E|nr:hypothetical protein [Belnapia sp. F-4-1]
MTVRRPDLVDVLAAHGVPPTHAEGTTRKQMEAGDLPQLKGPRSATRASYSPKDCAVALLGLAGAGPSEGHAAYAQFLPLEVKASSGSVVLDPIGRLLPDLLAKNPAHSLEAPIDVVSFLTEFITNISALSAEDAAILERSPEARSVRLDLCGNPAFMVFRWSSDGVEHFVRWEHPAPLEDIFGSEPPAFQRTTILFFPLLFAVARLFAGENARSETTASPSRTDNSAGLSEDPSVPENEKTPDLPGSGASTRFQSCNGAKLSPHSTGHSNTPENSVGDRERQAPWRGGRRATPRQKAHPHARPSQERPAYSPLE